MSAEKHAAYERLDAAIQEVCRVEEFEGVPVEWVIVNAFQRFDDEGGSITQIGTLLPDGGGRVAYHRVMGLLDYALTRCRAEVASDDE